MLYFESEKKQQLEALYFAAFSIINNNVQNVLEIGTGLGWNTVILSSLYNQAKIYTYDLPVNDRDYSTLAWTQQDEYFLDKINKENIIFKEKNSFFMMEDDLPDLDLIYVDGGHSYPSLAWDTMFAYHKTSPQGMIIFHDYDRPNNDPTRDANHVKDIIDGYLSELIQEKIHYLPWAETDGRARICIIQKN